MNWRVDFKDDESCRCVCVVTWWSSMSRIRSNVDLVIFLCKEKMPSEEYLSHSHVDLSSISSAQGDYRDLAGTEPMPHLYSASQHIHSP